MVKQNMNEGTKGAEKNPGEKISGFYKIGNWMRISYLLWSSSTQLSVASFGVLSVHKVNYIIVTLFQRYSKRMHKNILCFQSPTSDSSPKGIQDDAHGFSIFIGSLAFYVLIQVLIHRLVNSCNCHVRKKIGKKHTYINP